MTPELPKNEPTREGAVFVSTEDVDDPSARALVEALRAASLRVLHSPRNPDRGPDERWPTWYATGCDSALREAGLFVAVMTPGWDGSTWMAHEADAAQRCSHQPVLASWNPQRRPVPVGMRRYVGRELPEELGSAAAEVRRLLTLAVARDAGQ